MRTTSRAFDTARHLRYIRQLGSHHVVLLYVVFTTLFVAADTLLATEHTFILSHPYIPLPETVILLNLAR